MDVTFTVKVGDLSDGTDPGRLRADVELVVRSLFGGGHLRLGDGTRLLAAHVPTATVVAEQGGGNPRSFHVGEDTDEAVLEVNVTDEGVILDAYDSGQLQGSLGMTAAEWFDRVQYRDLALWFTPDAIRDHFEMDDDDPTQGLTDEQLAKIGYDCLSDDALYATFHEVLQAAIDDVVPTTEGPLTPIVDEWIAGREGGEATPS